MELQPYQKSVLAKGDRPFALHGTGTGKTLTSLKFIERSQKENPDKPTILITSSALRDNLAKEKHKHDVDVDLSRVHTVTHEGMSRPTISKIVNDSLKQGGTLVIDEIHKLRNSATKGYINTMEASNSADKVLGLTGTAIINEPDDLSKLYNLVQGKRGPQVSKFTREVTPRKTLIDKIRGRTPKVRFEITDEKRLKECFTSLDIYYPPKDDPMVPTVTSRTEVVEMPKHQILAYKNALNETIGDNPELLEIARKIRRGEGLTKTESKRQNMFSSQTSQAAISSAKHLPGPVYSGKIDKVVDTLKSDMREDINHRTVIYTNKIGAGIEPLVDKLSAERLADKVQIVQGSTKKSEVKDIVNNYNTGEKPILVISDSGAEGLDLKGTRKIHALNPHFNDGKIKQAVGRGARFGSHTHLPEKDRNIDIIHYRSKLPDGWFGKKNHTIDHYMQEMSDEKARRRDMVISVLSD